MSGSVSLDCFLLFHLRGKRETKTPGWKSSSVFYRRFCNLMSLSLLCLHLPICAMGMILLFSQSPSLVGRLTWSPSDGFAQDCRIGWCCLDYCVGEDSYRCSPGVYAHAPCGKQAFLFPAGSACMGGTVHRKQLCSECPPLLSVLMKNDQLLFPTFGSGRPERNQ